MSAAEFDMAKAIELQASRVHRLTREKRPLSLDRLRDEAAALQMLIAEAAAWSVARCR